MQDILKQARGMLAAEAVTLMVAEFIVGFGFGISLPGLLFAVVVLIFLSGLLVNVLRYVEKKGAAGNMEGAVGKLGLFSVIGGVVAYLVGTFIGHTVLGIVLGALLTVGFAFLALRVLSGAGR